MDLWKQSDQVGQGLLFGDSASATLAALEHAFLQARAPQYGALVAFVICMYDYMLTIGDEVELLWANMDYKLSRILYLLVRKISPQKIYCFVLGMNH